MKNNYEVRGDVTCIYVNGKGVTHECIISTSDLEKAKEFPNTWYASYHPNTDSFYVHGHLYKPKQIKIQLHRFIIDVPIGIHIDHANHDTLDNTRSNLRLAAHKENMQNRRAIRNTVSGVRNVSWCKPRNKWQVIMAVNGKQRHFGYFIDLKEAEIFATNLRRKHMPFSQI
jgi:hypothetical protein